jgi:HD superfamily phosphodiesterase
MFREKALEEAKKVFENSPEQMEHALKVLGYAEEIMEGENVAEQDRELVVVEAILHDIGIPEAIVKHGSAAAPYQEKEGKIIAGEILQIIGYPQDKAERICYIIGHHHTASKIDGLDFQIQWEADLLVNLENMEIRNDKEKLIKCIDENFKTDTGKSIAHRVFLTN